jgi:hypothetical protein
MWMMGALFHTFSLLNERHLEEVSLVCDSQDTGSAGRIYSHHRLNQFCEGWENPFLVHEGLIFTLVGS